jgi:hypothetical protein
MGMSKRITTTICTKNMLIIKEEAQKEKELLLHHLPFGIDF